MKFVILSLVQFILVTSCTSLHGVYCTASNYTGNCIDLKKNGEFSFDQASCTWHQIGAGKFKMIRDSLLLNFIELDAKQYGSFTIDKLNESKDSVDLILEVTETDTKESAKFISVEVYSKKELITGAEGDGNGIAELSVNFNKSPIRIVIKRIGYYPIDFEIQKPGKYRVKIELEPGINPYLMPKQKRIYKVISWSRDSLELGNFDENEFKKTLYRMKK